MPTPQDLRQRENGTKGPDPLARKTHERDERRDGSPPAVAAPLRGSAPARSPFHRCSCGAEYSRAEWSQLACPGTQYVPATVDDPAMLLELRNCTCGSTMSVDLYTTGHVARPISQPRHPKLLQALTEADRAGDHELVERLLGELRDANRGGRP